MYIGIAFWDCAEIVVSAWVNGEPVIVPTAEGKDSIEAESYINDLGEIVVGKHPETDSPLKCNYNAYFTFSELIGAGVATVTEFLQQAVQNAEKLTYEKVERICVAIPIIFSEADKNVLQNAAERLAIPIAFVHIGDVMAYLFASSDRHKFSPKRFAILHNDSRYAEFGIYELRDQEIVRYMLQEIPSPLKTLSRYVEAAIEQYSGAEKNRSNHFGHMIDIMVPGIRTTPFEKCVNMV